MTTASPPPDPPTPVALKILAIVLRSVVLGELLLLGFLSLYAAHGGQRVFVYMGF